MKIVLDTNVLIAAFISHGACAELLEHCALYHDIVLSKAILDEFLDVLVRKFGFSRTESRQAVSLVRSRAALVKPTPMAKPICRDPDDDVVLATAEAGDCDCLISGDKALLVIGEYSGIRILSPGEFWAFEGEMRKG